MIGCADIYRCYCDFFLGVFFLFAISLKDPGLMASSAGFAFNYYTSRLGAVPLVIHVYT